MKQAGDIVSGAVTSRTPHGVRGLKPWAPTCRRSCRLCRTPHGVRGLKPADRRYGDAREDVAPLTGCVD